MSRSKLGKFENYYKALASTFLREGGDAMICEDVTTGTVAWTIAHRCGITKHAYDQGREITDAHIVTVLKKVFPNAVFGDKYRY